MKQNQADQPKAARQIIEIGVNTSPKESTKPHMNEGQKQSIEIHDEGVDQSSIGTQKKQMSQ